MFLTVPVRVRVPATSANLGPGFDAFGLALRLYDEVTARVAGSGVRVTVTGEGQGELAVDESHLVVRSMYAAFDRLGGRPAGIELTCDNRIPQARGVVPHCPLWDAHWDNRTRADFKNPFVQTRGSPLDLDVFAGSEKALRRWAGW